MWSELGHEFLTWGARGRKGGRSSKEVVMMVVHASPLPEPHFSVSEAASSLPVSRGRWCCYLQCIERLTNRECWELLLELSIVVSRSAREREQAVRPQKAKRRSVGHSLIGNLLLVKWLGLVTYHVLIGSLRLMLTRGLRRHLSSLRGPSRGAIRNTCPRV